MQAEKGRLGDMSEVKMYIVPNHEKGNVDSNIFFTYPSPIFAPPTN